MLGFTLSKLNMLILVTAMFVIIVFFMQSLTSIVVANQANQLVSSYIEKTSSAILSESLCFKTGVTVPEFITYFGGATQGEKLFIYALKISKVEDLAGEGLSSLIMSVSNRQFQEKFLAAKRVDVKARIKIYDWNPETDTIVESGEGFTLIDPQAFPPINSFVLIKEVFRDQTFLHVIPCAGEAALNRPERTVCNYNAARIGCLLLQERGVASACVPKLETC